jgi:hypothetical protein
MEMRYLDSLISFVYESFSTFRELESFLAQSGTLNCTPKATWLVAWV